MYEEHLSQTEIPNQTFSEIAFEGDQNGKGLFGYFPAYSTKYSGLKFQVFYGKNGTVFSGWLDQPVPGHHVPSSAWKYEINKKENKQMTLCLLYFFLAVLDKLDNSEYLNVQAIYWDVCSIRSPTRNFS